MDLKRLECFVRVAELGSYTKASIVTSMPQPTLSRLVRQLEVELSRNLFVRNGRGIALTEEGACYYFPEIMPEKRPLTVEKIEKIRETMLG